MAFVATKGTRVAGRYQLIEPLGEGGMGVVWAATHTVTKKVVALKFLKGHARPDDRRRFQREARAASAVRHPSVVPIHDILEEDGTPVLVMDLLVGHTLAAVLAKRRVLTLDEAAPVLAPVISAVGTAHAAGIIHRDLKPDNIFICDGVDGRIDIKVLDFGIAKLTATEGDAAQTAGITRTGELLGTPYYMSPEQAFGEHDVDHRADIWALGVILYECLAGCRPFEGDNVGQVLKKVMVERPPPLSQAAPTVPREIAELVDRMLAVDRAARPADLRQMLALLREHTDQAVLEFGTARHRKAVVTGPERTDPFAKTTLGTRRAPWLGVAGAVLALSGIGFTVAWRYGHAQKHLAAPIAEAHASAAPPQELPTPPSPPHPVATAAVPPASPPTAKPDHPRRKPKPEKRARSKLPGGVVDKVPF